jgi:zinc D-Ala-D-Ala carboxypeptidase
MRSSLLCKCCGSGSNIIQPELLKRLEQLEKEVGSLTISSGYRCPKHNKEVGGEPNSAHTKGYAIDISCKDGREVRRILTRALPIFNRIGISAKSSGRFIHVDCDPSLPQGTIWSY